MEASQFEDFLKQNGIEFKEGKWRIGKVPIDPKTIVGLEPFKKQSVFPEDEALAYLKGKLKSEKPKITSADMGRVTIGIFLDELAKKPDDRVYVDKQLPQMVVDRTLKQFPYQKDIPANKFNESDLVEQYKLMMEMNKKIWGPIKNVETMFSNYMKKQRAEQELEIIHKIKFDAAKIPEADQFLGELYNLYQPAFVVFGDECRYDFEFFKGVVRHLIWNIKTKAWMGSNKYPFMLNLSGEQGNGKTSFVRHLCQDILQNMFSIQNIDVLNDDFGSRLLTEQWVLFFDEMVKRHGNIDVDKLKQTITNNEVKSRIMFSQKYETNSIRCVFIGSANRPVYEIIQDETGNRRYLNIEFRNQSIKNYKTLHGILDQEWEKHGLAIWQSVDEGLPAGYLTGDLEILWDLARNTYMSESNTIVQWLKATDSVIRTAQSSKGITLDEAHESYKAYWTEKDRRAHTMTLASFKTFIKNQYNSRASSGKAKTSYTPGELRISIAEKQQPALAMFMQGPEDAMADLTDVPASLNKYRSFKPVDLGPGNHLTDFTRVAAPDADGADASANGQSAVSGQISPISDNKEGNIGNIGMNGESNRDLVMEDGVRRLVGQSDQSRQHLSPFDAEDWVPTEEEIEWMNAHYGPDDDDPEAEAVSEAATAAAAEYLKDWWAREKARRAKAKADAATDEDDDFFKRLEQTEGISSQK
jgi:hypothetical protein